jgi:hypothetical protein
VKGRFQVVRKIIQNVIQCSFPYSIWGSHGISLPPVFTLVSCSAYSTLRMEAKWSKWQLTFNGLHTVISQKIVLFSYP